MSEVLLMRKYQVDADQLQKTLVNAELNLQSYVLRELLLDIIDLRDVALREIESCAKELALPEAMTTHAVWKARRDHNEKIYLVCEHLLTEVKERLS